MSWIAFYSRTGQEIINLSRHINRWPDLIITNTQNGIHEDISRAINHGETSIIHVNQRSKLYSGLVKDIYGICDNLPKPFITLHGWLKIVPSDVCMKYHMFNGHPGLIQIWPELKGKDPQDKVYQQQVKYPIIGSVIHKVTPEVDGGEVIIEKSISNSNLYSLKQVYDELTKTSLRCWIDFFEKYSKIIL